MMELVQISELKAIVINTIDCGSMCTEFDPGPSTDDLYPEYYNCSVEVKLIDIRNNNISDLNYEGMKKYYKKVEGRSLRIAYWRVMKYVKYLES